LHEGFGKLFDFSCAELIELKRTHLSRKRGELAETACCLNYETQGSVVEANNFMTCSRSKSGRERGQKRK